jgi:hypothetical protein
MLLTMAIAVAATTSATSARTYWHICAAPPTVIGIMLTHRVGCPHARRVIKKVLVKSQTAPGTNSIRAKGYTCHLRPYAQRAITCRRGQRRILSPLAG